MRSSLPFHTNMPLDKLRETTSLGDMHSISRAGYDMSTQCKCVRSVDFIMYSSDSVNYCGASTVFAT